MKKKDKGGDGEHGSGLAIGLCLGVAIGTSVSAATHSMVWMAVGISVGLCLGVVMDRQRGGGAYDSEDGDDEQDRDDK